MPPSEAGERAVTLGEAMSGVRWDFDPSQQLLSPLVEAARYFEAFPWEGEDDAAEEAPAAHPGPVG